MVDTKNIETALEHFENARKALDLQIENIQTQLAKEQAEISQQKEQVLEEQAELSRQKEQLEKELRQFEAQKADLKQEKLQFEEQKTVILENLRRVQQELQEELDNSKDTATTMPAEAAFTEKAVAEEETPATTPLDTPEQSVAPKEDAPQKPSAKSEMSFIEIDDEEPAPKKSFFKKKEEPKSVSSSTTPILGMAVPVNDLASSLQQQPLKDLAKGMGINDRFLFTKELFDGNTQTFNEVVKKLNNLGNLPEATAYLARFSDKWDLESDVVKQFMLLVHRRYL